MANSPQQTGASQPRDEEEAKQVLRDYIFYHRDGTDVHFVPHRIPPQMAAQLIEEEVDAEAPAEHIGNACEVVRFYLLRNCLGHFGGFLSRSTREIEDVYRSLQSVDLLGDLGEEADRGQAEEQWSKLAKHDKIEKLIERFVDSFFHLGPDASPKPLEDQLQVLRKQCDEEKSDAAEVRKQQLEHAEGLLARAGGAKQQKEKVAATARPDVRAYGTARLYLGLTEFSTFIRDWAGYALIVEAEKSGPDVVVDGMRRALTEFQKTDFGRDDPELVKTFKEDAQARAYNTIAFFGGKLEEEEDKFLAKDPPPPQNMYTPT